MLYILDCIGFEIQFCFKKRIKSKMRSFIVISKSLMSLSSYCAKIKSHVSLREYIRITYLTGHLEAQLILSLFVPPRNPVGR